MLVGTSNEHCQTLLTCLVKESKTPQSSDLADIWQLTTDGDEKMRWSKVAAMKYPRSSHAVSLVSYSDFKDYCES